MNLSELLDHTASRWPGKAALIEESKVVSFSELVRAVDNMAARLRSFALPPGARAGLCLPNSVQYVVLTFALWRIDAVVVPIPVEFTEDELASLASSMQLDALLGNHSAFRNAHAAFPGEASEVEPGCHFKRLPVSAAPDNHGLNLAFIRFTSGTTSARKGVALCHETVRDRVVAANRAFGIGPDDIVIWCLPMSHHFLITIVLYLREGATIVLARHVVAGQFIGAVNRAHGTVLYATPFQYSLLARDKSGAQMPSVRLAVSTTCALAQDVAEDFHRRFGIALAQALGVIELGLVALNRDDPLNRWNSVGRPIPDLEVRVLDPDENGCGEIVVRGPGICDAYSAPWVSSAEILRDGWFHTGDLGYLDPDGFLFLVSRKTAVINMAGRKVFPEEIEAVLNRHPDVSGSRVYGRLHAHLGEVIEADVVLRTPGASLDSVRALCRASLANYKVPSRLNVVTELPVTAVTGKIRRAPAVVS
jgi:long-chain acyl-CoA synthetase